MSINYNCRYCDPEGVCQMENRLCDSCNENKKDKVYIKALYDPFKNMTTITLHNNKGSNYMSAEVYGQIPSCVIKETANDMTKILIKKGVIK